MGRKKAPWAVRNWVLLFVLVLIAIPPNTYGQTNLRSNEAKNQKLEKLLDEYYHLACNVNNMPVALNKQKKESIEEQLYHLKSPTAFAIILKWWKKQSKWVTLFTLDWKCIPHLARIIPFAEMNTLLEKNFPSLGSISIRSKIQIQYFDDVIYDYRMSFLYRDNVPVNNNMIRLQDILYQKYKTNKASWDERYFAVKWAASLGDPRVSEWAQRTISDFQKNQTGVEQAKFWIVSRMNDYQLAVASLCAFQKPLRETRSEKEQNAYAFLQEMEKRQDIPPKIRKILYSCYSREDSPFSEILNH